MYHNIEDTYMQGAGVLYPCDCWSTTKSIVKHVCNKPNNKNIISTIYSVMTSSVGAFGAAIVLREHGTIIQNLVLRESGKKSKLLLRKMAVYWQHKQQAHLNEES